MTGQKKIKDVFFEDDTCVRWFETVTPESAGKYLSEQAPNRRLSAPTVSQYAEDIKRGDWTLTHQNAIALNPNGQGIDLQHRMQAVIVAQIPVKMEFYQYKKESDVVAAQLSMDGSRTRTIGDKGQILYGMTNAMRKFAVIALLKTLATNVGSANKR